MYPSERRSVFSLAGIYALRMLGLKIPSVGTLATAQFPERIPRPLSRALWKRVGTVLTATNYVHDLCAQYGVTTRIVRHGVVRDLRAELEQLRDLGVAAIVRSWVPLPTPTVAQSPSPAPSCVMTSATLLRHIAFIRTLRLLVFCESLPHKISPIDISSQARRL